MPDLASALQDLVAEGTLSADQAARVADRLGAPFSGIRSGPRPPARRGGRLAEVAGYAGGALLLGAAVLFLTSGWDDLSDAGRGLILGCASVVLLVAGALIALGAGRRVRELGRDRGSARRRLVSVLWTCAAAAAGGAGALAVDSWQAVAAGGTALVVVTVTYLLVPSVVGQLGGWLAAVCLVCGLVAELGDEPGETPYAVALLAVAGAWCAAAVTGVLREREAGLALGASLGLFAAQLPVLGSGHEGLGYAFTAGVAVAGYGGFLVTRSWAVLGVGVVATTLVVPEALYDWTDGSVSAAGVLLAAGLTLIGASAAGLRLRREVA